MSFDQWRSLVDGAEIDIGSDIPDSGLKHRYDATELDLSDGETVSSWSDGEGAADLSGGNPTFVEDAHNTEPAVRFDGSDDILEAINDASDWTFLSNGSEWTIYLIAAPRGDVFSNQLSPMGTADSTDSDIGLTIDYPDSSSDTVRFILSNGSEFTYLEDGLGTLSEDTLSMWGGLHDGSQIEFRLDGAEQRTESADASYSPDAPENALQVGASAANDYFDGDICEILIYEQELTSSERDDLENALAEKWGISI